jgi:hypothetical protein
MNNVAPTDDTLRKASRYKLLDAPGNLALRPRREVDCFYLSLSQNFRQSLVTFTAKKNSIAGWEDLHI